MSLVIFALVLSILILVHEWGHFAMAKSMGVKVERFSLGFGPKLFSKFHNGTEFMLCAIPLGGYVKMAGDERKECKGLADEYFSKPPGRRALIVLMGPVVNYFLAFLCLWVVFVLGYPTLSNKVGEVLKGYPAQVAGIEPGDQIISVDSLKTQSWDDVRQYISKSKAPQLKIFLKRNGQTLEKVLTPKDDVLKNVFGQQETVRVVGIKPKEEVVKFRYGFVESFGKAWQKLWEMTALTYKSLYRIVTGGMSAKDAMTGPIGIFYVIKEAAAMGFSYLLYIVSVISASLAIFNLLPFPVLDGGHLVLLGVEKIRGRGLSEKTDDVIARFGFSMILALAVFVFYCDMVRFGWFEKIFSLWR